MIEIKIELEPPEDEAFDANDLNIVKVRIQLPTGELIDDPAYRVELRLSRDAMLGLGTNLIRAAYSDDSALNFWHLYPSELNRAVQDMGVYLHPSSCQLLVSEGDFKTLQEELESEQAEPSGE